MPHHPSEALRAWFLGPSAENADLFERLVTEALRDHVFWRRNFHPEDGIVIREKDRRAPGYDDAVARLTQELMTLFASLKSDVPFFSGRYKGHMVFEPTIAAQVGYFAAMLYNPNNISTEVAPVTTRLELEVARQLAAMVGHPADSSWGHLTSGGTIANLEAIWIARSLLYLPVSLALTARRERLPLEVTLPSGRVARLTDLPLYQLLNLRGSTAIDLRARLLELSQEPETLATLEDNSLAHAGYQEYTRLLERSFGDPLGESVVLVSATAHYSWEKVVRTLGIGSRQLILVPVDVNCRMDPDALWDKVRELHRQRVPIMACVGVCGTTEESAVDRLDLLAEVRQRAEVELDTTFYLHADAAYGGYAASVFRGADGGRRSAAQVRAANGSNWPPDTLDASYHALGAMDSVTIDPHKLGYIPYPAGAILVRDRRARELVAVQPPYLEPAAAVDAEEYLGRFIIEGSKPGAAAAAAWMSHAVLPLDERGYGYLIERTVLGARRLYHALAGLERDGYTTVMFPEPDLNIVCFVLRHASCRNLRDLNRLNDAVYSRMSHGSDGRDPDYVITRTRLTSPPYDGSVPPLLEKLGVPLADWQQAPRGLTVLRATVMDPFLLEDTAGAQHVTGFLDALVKAAADS